jgi:hypothetical protein
VVGPVRAQCSQQFQRQLHPLALQLLQRNDLAPSAEQV